MMSTSNVSGKRSRVRKSLNNVREVLEGEGSPGTVSGIPWRHGFFQQRVWKYLRVMHYPINVSLSP